MDSSITYLESRMIQNEQMWTVGTESRTNQNEQMWNKWDTSIKNDKNDKKWFSMNLRHSILFLQNR